MTEHAQTTSTTKQTIETTPLLVTQKARQRVIAGLSWDHRLDKVTIIRRAIGDSQHDLDLSAYLFSRNKEYLDYIGGMAQDSIDFSGTVYHSGDDQSGIGSGDDEFISAELLNVPEDIYCIVFVVEIHSKHVFSQVTTPFFRIADAYGNENLLELPIEGPLARLAKAYIPCAIRRNPQSPTGWDMVKIAEFPNVAKIKDWGAYLSKFVD